METSIFLAKAIGIWFAVTGIALIKNPDTFKSFARVLFHNVWLFSWPLLITLFGWIALTKGALLLIFPDFGRSFAEEFIDRFNLRFFGVAYLVIALFFFWKGFF